MTQSNDQHAPPAPERAAVALDAVVRRFVRWDSKSTDPKDRCEYCHDTGYSGDLGPGGGRHNNEYTECCCDPVARIKRKRARDASAPNAEVSGFESAAPTVRTTTATKP
jgi:hypothetical protein